MKKVNFFLLPLLLLLLISLSSCSRKIGYGVVLWSNQEQTLPTGAFTEIIEESRIRQSYILRNKETKENFEIPTWRVKFFKKAGPAQNYSKQFKDFVPFYAYSEKQGLPIREKANASSERVYKLRENQELKVISKGEEVSVGRFKGHWYNVLTEDGTSGFVFDAYLKVYSLNNKQEMVLQNAKNQTNPVLENFFTTDWRPEWYFDMISKKQIDLSKFRNDYGVFADSTNKTISLKTPDINITEKFNGVTRIGANRYDFLGSSFRITFNSEKFISVQYKHEGLEHSESYIKLDQSVDETIAQEKARRLNLFKEFIDRGAEMSSHTYGTVLLENSRRFTWVDKTSLISQGILSVNTGNMGYISFDTFPKSSFSSNYDGAITFSFETGEQLHFLYLFKNKGISLLYVPPRYIEDRIIKTNQFFDPIQVFFTFPPSIKINEEPNKDTV